jgi:HD-GYP domain-containing protein (c-di-GMP phosphodiesterase class II)
VTHQPNSRTCRYHRTSLAEPFRIPDELLARGESAHEQVTRLGRLVRRCAHDGYRLANHSVDVMTLSARLARFVGFDQEQIRLVRVGSYLHDLGKIFTALDVLLSPKHGLDDAEWEEVMRHPSEGAALVTHAELANVRRMVSCHHEWPGNPGRHAGGFDYPRGYTESEIAAIAAGGHAIRGRHGYPSRARREDLSDEILLLSVCDWYAGCAERRVYRSAQPHAIAMSWTEEAAALGKIDPQFTRRLGQMLAAEPWVPCTSTIEPAAAVTC